MLSYYQLLITLVVLSALFSYLNIRVLRMPFSIGLMVLGVLFSLAIVVAEQFFPALKELASSAIGRLDFSVLILDIMLPYLLFAGALHTDAQLLKQERRSIIVSSVVGVLMSTVFIGYALYLLLPLLGIELGLLYCLLFGSLISPTDPIAVLGILTKAKVPKRIEMNIVGESLFNDGVGVVVYLAVLGIIRTGFHEFIWWETLLLFLKEAGGGLLFGYVLGRGMIWVLKSIDHFETEVMITLATVMLGYQLAQSLHISGPLAIVILGLLAGNKGRSIAMSTTTETYVFKFWELMDVLLNAILFVLIGLRVLTLEMGTNYLWATLLAIAVVLLARWISVHLGIWMAGVRTHFPAPARKLLVWGGLRGGLSIALALSLNPSVNKDLIVFITYGVVLFSIIVQGLTIGMLAKRLFPPAAQPSEADPPSESDMAH